MKTNLMHYLSLDYFVYQTLHISGIFLVHHLDVHYIYIYNKLERVVLFNRQSTKKHNMFQFVIYIYTVYFR